MWVYKIVKVVLQHWIEILGVFKEQNMLASHHIGSWLYLN
jgi:hypothetical protein